MSPSPTDYLRHILDEAEYIAFALANISSDEFSASPTLTRAITRSIEIIGEATKNLPTDFKVKFPDIEWRNISRMRDKLIHHYFGTDYDIVWDTAKNAVPLYANAVREMLNQLNNESD